MAKVKTSNNTWFKIMQATTKGNTINASNYGKLKPQGCSSCQNKK